MATRCKNNTAFGCPNVHFFIYAKQQNTAHYSIAINIINWLVNLKAMRIMVWVCGGVGVAFPLLVYVTGLKICILILSKLAFFCWSKCWPICLPGVVNHWPCTGALL